jgi:hypothetical protein
MHWPKRPSTRCGVSTTSPRVTSSINRFATCVHACRMIGNDLVSSRPCYRFLPTPQATLDITSVWPGSGGSHDWRDDRFHPHISPFAMPDASVIGAECQIAGCALRDPPHVQVPVSVGGLPRPHEIARSTQSSRAAGVRRRATHCALDQCRRRPPHANGVGRGASHLEAAIGRGTPTRAIAARSSVRCHPRSMGA